MKHSRRGSYIAAVGVVLASSIGLAAMSASAETEPAVAAVEPQRDCGADFVMTSEAGQPGEVPDEAKWAASPEAADAFVRLDEVIKGDPGLLDLRVDYGERVITLVTEPGQNPSEASTAEINAVGDSIDVTTTVVEGCASKAALDDAATRARDVTGLVADNETIKRDGGVAVSANYSSGRVEIRATDAVAEGIKARMGEGSDLVDHAGGPVQLGARVGDLPPHFGGAQYTIWNTGTYVTSCTTGFGAIFNLFGPVDTMATAAHCGRSTAPAMGGYSAGHLIGLFATNGAFASYVHPGPSSTYGLDVAVMYNSSTTYSTGLYTDPGLSPRYATSYGDALGGQPVCMNGSVTLATCGSVLADANSTICGYAAGWYTTKCMWAPRFYRFVGGVSQGGDSGGTVYQQTGGSTAKISGTITGGDLAGNNTFVTPTSFFQANAITPKT